MVARRVVLPALGTSQVFAGQAPRAPAATDGHLESGAAVETPLLSVDDEDDESLVHALYDAGDTHRAIRRQHDRHNLHAHGAAKLLSSATRRSSIRSSNKLPAAPGETRAAMLAAAAS